MGLYIYENSTSYNQRESRMKLDSDWVVISRYVLGESSKEENTTIETRIKSDKDFAKLVEDARKVVNLQHKPLEIKNVDLKWQEIKADLHDIPSEKSVNSSGNKVTYLNARKRAKKYSSSFMRYAAVILFTIGLSYFFSKEFFIPEIPQKIEYKTVSVNRGERKTIVLYDGTTINLDSGSELRYPKKFGDTREVYLKGEGFFQVAKNPLKPFLIYAENAQIRVLGTKFNVRSWAEDSKGVTVTVAEGKVSLSNKLSDIPQKIILTKNMQSSLSENGKLSDPIIVEATEYSKWIQNDAFFRKASLKQVILQLQRWYNVEFEVDEDLLERVLTIHLENKSLNDILNLIAVVTNTTVKKDGNKILLTK